MNQPAALYIDDDEGLRRLAAKALKRRGYTVTVAGSGAEGVALARATAFDVIAVDHYMPDLNGLETLALLRALPVTPPVVYVTGSEEGSIAVASLKAGASDYVIKTIGDDFFDLLGSAFQQVLARALLEQAKMAAESALRATNARLEALLSEVNHRVANSLQMVSAMVGMQAGVSNGETREALADTQRRIAAIAQVHRRLYTSNDVESVDMREYLAALVAELSETWSTPDAPRTLSLDAEPIRLPTDRAVSLGVIVTELVSNACKYAYPARAGEVRVALTSEGEGHFLLAVEDDGIGMEIGAKPRGTGLGTKLIRAMAQSLHSIVEYDTNRAGVRAVLRAAV
jgi:two-component sensor histidine kinase